MRESNQGMKKNMYKAWGNNYHCRYHWFNCPGME